MFINTHSYYSLRFGTIKPEELLLLAQQRSLTALALTDINNTSACLDFVRLASKYNIKPVLGVDFRNGVQQQFVLLAKNNEGFMQINRYLSYFLHSEENIPERAKILANTFVIYPYATFKGDQLSENEFLGVKIEDLNRLKFSPRRKF